MADEVRTVLKNFNRDLLREELTASALPYESLHLAGFIRLNQAVGTPAPADVVITRKRETDGSYTEDLAAPGEIRFVFTTALTGAEGTALDALLTAHDSTDRTQEQNRQIQDNDDVDTLVAQYANYDSFTDAQFKQYVKLLARVAIRAARSETPI